jgi:hypothetical protein
MVATTLERIKATASHLASVSDITLELFIEDAASEVSKLNAPEEYQERLIRYLTIHFASMSNKTVLKEKLEGLEKTYADSGMSGGLLSTPYGTEYQRLLDEIPGTTSKKTLNLLVL